MTPSFNQGVFIEETIRSVLLQGYPDLEYIIMDGGSTDDTRSVLEKYKQWFAFCTSKRDGGQSSAINSGMERATGVLGNWLNSDDVLQPGALFSAAIGYLEANGVSVVLGRSEYRDVTGANVIFEEPPMLTSRDELLGYFQGKYVPQPSCFFGVEKFRRAGALDINQHFAMDLDLWFRLFEVSPPATRQETFSWMRAHEGAKTFRDRRAVAEEVALIFDRYHPTWRTTRPEIARAMRRWLARNDVALASAAAQDKKRLVAWRHLLTAATSDPPLLLSRDWQSAFYRSLLPASE